MNEQPDWLLLSVEDRGAGYVYRYRITLMNHACNPPEKKSWEVPSLTDRRYGVHPDAPPVVAQALEAARTCDDCGGHHDNHGGAVGCVRFRPASVPKRLTPQEADDYRAELRARRAGCNVNGLSLDRWAYAAALDPAALTVAQTTAWARGENPAEHRVARPV